MNLELLPNEVLLDLFVYFNGIDLLRTFYNLNSRFNLLLYKKFQSYVFRFHSISKRDFDRICLNHLPFITNHIIALSLSDFKETPQQIHQFFSYIPSFRSFTNLQSLSISSLRTYQLLLKLLDECQHLNHLTKLKLFSCSFQNSSANFQLIIDKIWTLPKLTNCYADIEISNEQIFRIPTLISLSIEYLSIFSSHFQWNQMHQLIKYTPQLKYLSASIESSSNHNYKQITFSTLTTCDLIFFYESNIWKIDVIFQTMPNLRHLNINICFKLIDGHKWKQIIDNYLPRLKTLYLRMNETFSSERNIEEKVDEIINSFRTSFWINERRWFVRCYTVYNAIHLNTISNASNHYNDVIPDLWQSTCPDDNQQKFCNNITSIYDKIAFDKPISSDIRLPNIDYLSIKLPINDRFWSTVPKLNQLKSLSLYSYSGIYQWHVQTLLNRAYNLHTLRFSQDELLPFEMSLLNYRNASVRKLYLNNYNHIFHEEECLLLSRSPICIQCEVISLRVTNRDCIIYLVKKMTSLRSLIVQSVDDHYIEQSFLYEENDELIAYLKEHLPSTYSIIRDPESARNIFLWM